MYVDDTLLPVPRGEVAKVVDQFNSIHERIQFTVEEETDNAIAFLDIKVHRENDGSLKTNWYQKPTSAGRIINFRSNHPLSQKIGVAFGLLHRAFGLSHQDFHTENVDKVRGLLKANGYPDRFIRNCVKRFKDRRESPVPRPEPEITKGFSFPLIQGLTGRLEKCLKGTDSRLLAYNVSRVGDLYSTLKDKTPTLNRSEVIYKIPCQCSKCYIGQTKQLQDTRIKQHKRDCTRKGFLKKQKTALASHHFETEHRFQFDDVSILDTESNWRRRNISEMVQISLNNTVNLREDTQHLSVMYNNLLRKFKNARQNGRPT